MIMLAFRTPEQVMAGGPAAVRRPSLIYRNLIDQRGTIAGTLAVLAKRLA